MSYNTRYQLTQERNPVSAAKLAALITNDKEASYCLYQDGRTADRGSWYEHEASLCAWSQREPMTLFRLHGEGEESGDVWDKYFAGGKMVHEARLNPEIPKPDFDKLVADLKRTMRPFVMYVPISAHAYSAEEAKLSILAGLDQSGTEYEKELLTDELPVPLRRV